MATGCRARLPPTIGASVTVTVFLARQEITGRVWNRRDWCCVCRPTCNMVWTVRPCVARLGVARTAYAKIGFALHVSRVAYCNSSLSAALVLHLMGVQRDDTFGTQRGDERPRQVVALYSVASSIGLLQWVFRRDWVPQLVNVPSIPSRIRQRWARL